MYIYIHVYIYIHIYLYISTYIYIQWQISSSILGHVVGGFIRAWFRAERAPRCSSYSSGMHNGVQGMFAGNCLWYTNIISDYMHIFQHIVWYHIILYIYIISYCVYICRCKYTCSYTISYTYICVIVTPIINHPGNLLESPNPSPKVWSLGPWHPRHNSYTPKSPIAKVQWVLILSNLLSIRYNCIML